MNFYRFRGEPFGITPNPRFLFLSAAHREALAALVYGVSQRKGFISIIGEVGTGKTIILRAFLEGIDPSQTTAISLLNPVASFEQIIDEILPPDFEGSTSDRFRTLQEWLIEEYRQGRNVVVAIDEAQCMSPATMERLRLLSNLETAEHKLIQVVLAGQPELERKLMQPNLRQFGQRIAVTAKIWPLSQSDSVAYINYRISKVIHPGSKPIFTRLALNYLARKAKGNPRRLNILCDAALIAGFSYQKRPIPWSIAWEACSGTARRPKRGHTLFARTLAVAGLISVLLGSFWYGLGPLTKDTNELRSATTGTIHRQIARGDESRPVESSIVGAHITPAPKQVQAEALLEPKRDNTARHANPLLADHVSNAVENDHVLETRLARIPQTVVVNRGDGLWQLCRDIYGDVDSALVQMVIEANPHIQNPNDLTVGEEIMFPRLASMGEPVSARGPNTHVEE